MSCEPRPVETFESDVLLVKWRVFETDDGLRWLVGFHQHSYGCVSAALVSFDRLALRARTLDGLSYELIGNPGWFWEVVDVWDSWHPTHGGAAKDVTDELLEGDGVR